LRLEAARALGKLGPAAAVAVPALIAALQERNLNLRLAAVSALGGVGAAAAPAIPALAVAMAGVHLVLARLAAQALSRIGLPAVATLVELLQSSDPYVRREATWALGEIGPAVLDTLPPFFALCVPRQETQTVQSRNAKTPVIRLLKEEVIAEWTEQRRHSRPRGPLPDPVTALQAALADNDPKVCAAAGRALQRIQLA
jgi:HEAT repeat protein